MTHGTPIRILLAEDQAMVRGALAALLSLEPDFTIVAEIARGDQVLDAVHAQQPDIVLLDIEMPGSDGLSVAAELHATRSPSRVIILTTFGRAGYLRRALEQGATGFLLKDAPATELASAIRRAMRGERVVDPNLALTALSEGANPLTDRERDVLRATRTGATIAEIANALFLSQGTVRNHLSAAIQKLDAQNRIDAALIAEGKGWL